MSKSRSPSPTTHNLSISNIVNSPTSTTSRPHTLDESTTQSQPQLGLEGESTSPVLPSSPPTVFPLNQQPTTESGRKRQRTEDDSSEASMAKRIRIEFSPSRVENRSSPESDSQDEMADNEMDMKAMERHEQTPPAPPPKKKRTRTLTTPHQSAVLHALLAQSRFPTTAMREEVGRSIGLSARKVQIWFQNQRQKARRPRTQGDATVNRPPQYGPFSGAETSNIHRYDSHGDERLRYPRALSPEPHVGPSEIPPRLLGPGMPGAPSGYPTHGYRQVLPAPPSSAPGDEPSFIMSSTYRRSDSPHSYRSPLPTLRPVTSQAPGWRERQRDPSRTLPPLLPSRPSSSHPGPSLSAHAVDMSSHPFNSRRSISPEHPFAHHPPDSLARPSLHLPPPFTLQPAPHWDESAYLPRPSSSSWPRSGSRLTRGRSTSPITIRRDPTGRPSTGEPSSSDLHYHAVRSSLQSSSTPSLSTSTPPRSGRYDPIRAAFIPYTMPSATSPIQSPAHSGDEVVQEGESHQPSKYPPPPR
ncbi:hypothetical protein CPB83DRAFT_850193 [Crepidotus variabilis]|uniref:Homeobox domain-containing protein n=1 Tax=Crepidotus variabilis TaxID=179855 RepID=A0A9P6EKH2_9AGAR|nr:hypothetical protein CPB83DRAFT_850193 [Crepidotus variabilis]